MSVRSAISCLAYVVLVVVSLVGCTNSPGAKPGEDGAGGNPVGSDASLESTEDTGRSSEGQSGPGVDAGTTPADGAGGGADVATGGGGSSGLDSGGTSGTFIWANWPMPNPALDGSNNPSGLPNPASYDTSTVGVVIDRVTGLMWQEPLELQMTPGTKTVKFTWSDARAWCDGLNLAGYDDWRLPSRIELVSLLNFAVFGASKIDVTAFPSTISSDGTFWTSSPHVGTSPQQPGSWCVNFGQAGNVGTLSSDMYRDARCVRGGTPVTNHGYTVQNGAV